MAISNSYQIIKAISDTLFIPEQRRLDKDRDALIDQNQEAMGQSVDGFMWQGKFYKKENTLFGAGKRLTLHMSLWNEMDAHVADLQLVEHDRRMIEQSMFTIIEPCCTDQDIRDALPECLVTCVEKYMPMERLRSEAYTIRDNERAMRQYNRIKEKMEYYSVTRLLY